MTAFRDYYLKDVEVSLGREASEEEIPEILELYVKGWHPTRTANYIKTGKDE